MVNLHKEVYKILKNTPGILPIYVSNIPELTIWLFETISKYSEYVHNIYDVESALLWNMKKVYHIDHKGNFIDFSLDIANTFDEKNYKSSVPDDTYAKLNAEYKKKVDKLNMLLNLFQPEQKSKEWFVMREELITASAGADALNENHFPDTNQFHFILKKCGIGKKYEDNIHTHHGKKYERVAILLYEKRNNVKLLDFGLLKHNKINFLGASPDSICNVLTLIDGLTVLGCRMVEIKCPTMRKILCEGGVKIQCPHHYWIQIQLQLECCDLEECDFWQCKLTEYKNKEAYVTDCDEKDSSISKSFKLEHGAIIQLLPKGNKNEFSASFIYPPKINLSLKELEKWIHKESKEFDTNPKYKGLVIDKVIWWKLELDNCILVPRDKEWFKEKLPLFDATWNYVKFFREHKDKLDLWVRYIESRTLKKNNDIMAVAHDLMNDNKRGSKARRLTEQLDKLDESMKAKIHIKTEEYKKEKNTKIEITKCITDSDDD